MYNLSPFDNFLSSVCSNLVGVGDSVVGAGIDIIAFVDWFHY